MHIQQLGNSIIYCCQSRAEEEIPLLTTSIKADVDVKMGIISDIKKIKKAQAQNQLFN